MYYPMLKCSGGTACCIRWWSPTNEAENGVKVENIEGEANHECLAFARLNDAAWFVTDKGAAYAGVSDKPEYQQPIAGLIWRLGDPLPGSAPKVWRMLMGRR